MVNYMESETRQKRIEELKALRAELMAYKEGPESKTGEGSAMNSNILAVKKMYVSDAASECSSDTLKNEDVCLELYLQQNQVSRSVYDSY